ncbi:hypothetical protein [Methylomonas sp. MK1]
MTSVASSTTHSLVDPKRLIIGDSSQIGQQNRANRTAHYAIR